MNPLMIWEFVLGLIRHLLTFGGGWLVTSGIATETEVTTGTGFVVGALGLAWSWYRKWSREKANA